MIGLIPSGPRLQICLFDAFSSREALFTSRESAPEEILMRIPAWAASTILTIGMVSAAATARAQTYDPNFPICMHVVQIETSFEDCTYYTMDQCKASASGRAALCSINPFYNGASTSPGRSEWRRRRGY
jgi:hypothetical protein